jgi:tetratricopeptide (TPR) repeat protein
MGNQMSNSQIAQMMQEGIKLVKENRGQEAYEIFREVTTREPHNEFAWIWISVTSRDYQERRAALERALQINPSSSHAREALNNLEIEMSRSNPTLQVNAKNATAEERPVGMMGSPLSAQIDPLASLRDKGDRGTNPSKSSRPAKTKPMKVTSATTVNDGKKRSNVFGLIAATLVLVILILGGYWLYTNVINKPTEAVVPPPATDATPTVEATAGTPSAGQTPGTAPTTAAATVSVTTAPVATTAAPNVVATTAPAPNPTTAASGTPAAVATTSAPATSPTAQARPTTAAPTAPATIVTGGQAVTSSSQVDKLVQESRQSAAKGDYKTAISLATDAVRLNANNASVHLELGQLYLRAPSDQLGSGVNGADEAVRSFSRVTEIVPSWSGGFAWLGQAYATKGDIAKAIAAYDQAVKLDPNRPEVWLSMATLYERNNQTAEAAYARDRARGVLSPSPTPR